MRPAIAVLFVTAALMSLGCSEFDRLRIRAHLGGADSQILVGFACETGKGTEKDPLLPRCELETGPHAEQKEPHGRQPGAEPATLRCPLAPCQGEQQRADDDV